MKRRSRFPSWTQVGVSFVVVVLGFVALGGWLSLSIQSFAYVSSDGGFHDFELPAKGRDWRMMEAMFAEYRAEHGDDVVFYRTFERDPGWRWWRRDDAFYDESHPRWKLPYRPPAAK